MTWQPQRMTAMMRRDPSGDARGENPKLLGYPR